MKILPKIGKNFLFLTFFAFLSVLVPKKFSSGLLTQTYALTIEPELITNGSRDKPYVALTFDLCHSAGSGFDWNIYNYLKDNQIPATFFASGLWLENHQSEAQTLAQIDFFEIGLHGHTHTKLAELTEEEIKNELVLAQKALKQTTGRETNLFRLPYGTSDSYNDLVLRLIAEGGYYNIYWEVVTGDPDSSITADLIAGVVERETKPGSIIIGHANGKGWHTAEALPRIKEIIENKGLQFVTISQLLGISSQAPSPSPGPEPSPPPSMGTCPAVHLCGTPGPENDPFYPYPGSSCYRQTKEPKVILNYDLEANKTIPNPKTSSYNWNFTASAKVNNLAIPIVRKISDFLEGKRPFNRELPIKPLAGQTSTEDPLSQFGPVIMLTDPAQQKILKQTIAVSVIDSQCQPPMDCPAEGESSPNPIHDYIIAYAVPQKDQHPSADPAACNPNDWEYGGEEEAKNNPLARPIRASEIYCTTFLEKGHPQDEETTIKSKYADIICPKLYGKDLQDNTNGLYPKLLSEGNPKKVFCYLSQQTRDEVFEIFMPLVSHETEPAEVSLTFGDKTPAKDKVYLPHLARLEQLSGILQGISGNQKPTLTQTQVNKPEGGSAKSELICPATLELAPPAEGGGNYPITAPPESEFVSLKQSGNLQITIPDLLQAKGNLIGPQGFFRNWLDPNRLEELDKEIETRGDALGSGTVNLVAKENVDSFEPGSFQIRFPYLGAIDRYYQEFLKIFIPGGDPCQAAPVNTDCTAQPVKPWVTSLGFKVPISYSMNWPELGGLQSLHTGADVGGAYGTPIYAWKSGKVVNIGPLWLNGQGVGRGDFAIILDHGGGQYSTYSHNQKALVQVGDTVSAGQQIAEMGSEGYSLGPHLHFEIRENTTFTENWENPWKDGVYVDPVPLIPTEPVSCPTSAPNKTSSAKEKLDSFLGISYKSFGYKTDDSQWCTWTGYEPEIDGSAGLNCGGFLLEAVRSVFGQVSLKEIDWEHGRRSDRTDPTDYQNGDWLWFGYDEVMNLTEKFGGHVFKVDNLNWEAGSGYPFENLTDLGKEMKSGNLYLASLNKPSAEAGREHHHVFIILPYEGELLVYEATNYGGNGVIQTSLAKFQSKYTDRRVFVTEIPLP
jgi:murein DD-endopeptidase MepM/ murein hydrolase activator NlpD/peptidoglycan/xylan/chitin deacetylase (PgdA/CDA1 family)